MINRHLMQTSLGDRHMDHNDTNNSGAPQDNHLQLADSLENLKRFIEKRIRCISSTRTSGIYTVCVQMVKLQTLQIFLGPLLAPSLVELVPAYHDDLDETTGG